MKEAISKPSEMVCQKNNQPLGLPTSAKKLTSSARWLASLITKPTGCCIQPLASKIHRAERFDPIATSQIEAKCTFSGTLPSPKTQMPRNVDSSKNASKASIANG